MSDHYKEAGHVLRLRHPAALLLTVAVAAADTGAAIAQEAERDPNNGTDPTRLTTTAAVAYEYNDIKPNSSRHAPRLDLTMPFGEKQDYSIRLRVPVVSNDVTGDGDFGIGDVSLTGTHVFGLTRKRGLVVQGELILDSASRDELGTGRNVLKGTFIYARFLPQGIFAPALVHSVDIGGDDRRADVSVTTFDFYYVPKISSPRTFMTIDPALNFDWEKDAQFSSLAVTAGMAVGKAFGGQAQVYVKPTVMFGSERPGDWSIEVGFKVLGF
ncbi:hypothetical protein [Pseudoxanthomonas wuyuanensis]|uniref:MetA-pathway of phenol degradation n=1 Tax=Pseudoxanthomonas wuyuanensis TaxID=1073196 RepID=A0A286D5M0_9GAMM|nr:hypothetical protein [Pseudoxanthomonas wuyuanensis]KAF1719234.1 hypothetical protein CSC75_16145 [Pseudoxanthomonas wuyuanensis]SOD53961.1 hypothetical protein SAMN06296416_10323 [Pseudoxanthomonas wuyuanensis]